ncbi:MAG: RNA polymerase sigma factor [Actinomycetota bacterium]
MIGRRGMRSEPPPTETVRWPPVASRVAAAVSGDPEALTEILATGYPRVVAFYLGAGLDSHAADELAAETAEAVVAGIRRLRAPQAFEAWFWSVARNKLRTLFRKRRNTEPIEAMISPPSPEELSIEREEHRRIIAALNRLSTKDRVLLWLREVEGLDYQEIGGRMGFTAGTVRVAVHRARRRLEAIYLEEEPPG